MKELIKQLEEYKNANNMTWADVSRRLEIPENYIYRWREGKMSRAWQRIVKDFLDKNL